MKTKKRGLKIAALRQDTFQRKVFSDASFAHKDEFGLIRAIPFYAVLAKRTHTFQNMQAKRQSELSDHHRLLRSVHYWMQIMPLPLLKRI